MLFLRTFVTTVFFIGFFLSVQPAEAVKPMAPLEMTLELGGTPQVGGEVTVFVKVLSMVDAPQVKVGFTLPAGVEMVSDQGTWEGELTAGSLKQITFNFRVKEPGRHVIRATAEIQFQDGLRVTKGARLLIDLEPKKSLGIESKVQDKEKHESRVIKDKDGRDLKIFSFEKEHK